MHTMHALLFMHTYYFVLVLIHVSLNCDFVLQIVKCYKMIMKTNKHCYVVTILQVSPVKKFIKNVNPYAVSLFFYLSFNVFFSINLDVKQNHIHTLI